MTPRRLLTLTVLLCALGAVLVLVAVGRTWLVEVTPRPAPLSEIRTETTGGQLRPWLPASGWVALAGAGALLAIRGWPRRLVGALLATAGALLVAGAVASLAEPELSSGWPWATLAGGAAVAVAGVIAAARGHQWPSMGARYERSPAARRARRGDLAADPARSTSARPEELWDALDQGEDPTSR
ncbi:Trp biosynthesis-associated membrane protein [Natronosporangium hydrolyticum]|uniref:Trp biosynthesis-associated membrane protein n=1 Tax=Natronosporangium hydrolyticum TaxID=2811111 RepID=UPI001EFA09BB|nr:Trp biosynthesis-associated membrane protein [Natronosporangium hydrolyticum]